MSVGTYQPLATKVCEECITSIMDKDGASKDIADEMCRVMGSEITDHCCEGTREYPCACACQGAR